MRPHIFLFIVYAHYTPPLFSLTNPVLTCKRGREKDTSVKTYALSLNIILYFIWPSHCILKRSRQIGSNRRTKKQSRTKKITHSLCHLEDTRLVKTANPMIQHPNVDQMIYDVYSTPIEESKVNSMVCFYG